MSTKRSDCRAKAKIRQLGIEAIRGGFARKTHKIYNAPVVRFWLLFKFIHGFKKKDPSSQYRRSGNRRPKSDRHSVDVYDEDP